MNLTKRSYQKELLDREDIPFDDILQNMRELDIINHRLGGHAITIEGLKHFIKRRSTPTSSIHIVEIGCGGGDNLRVLATYCKRHRIAAKFTGIDINPHCTQVAREYASGIPLNLITSDYAAVHFEDKPEVIFSSLFCHHFNEEQLTSMFRWMHLNSSWGFFINDLQRHPLAYHSIKLLTRLFSKSYLVRHDAPLSVARGFHEKELKACLDEAGISDVFIQWKWAFRFLVIAAHPNQLISRNL